MTPTVLALLLAFLISVYGICKFLERKDPS
jgi:hypothetical protein